MTAGNYHHGIVRLPHISGLPEDTVEVTFNLLTSAAVESPSSAPMQAFWNTVAAGSTHATGEYLGRCIDRSAGAASIEWYTIDDHLDGSSGIGSALPGAIFTLPAQTGSDEVPAEVASCLSYAGDLSSVPEVTPLGPAGPAGDRHDRARRRGRMFIGPLTASVCIEAVAPKYEARVKAAFREDVCNQFKVMVNAYAALGDEFCVWSRAAADFFPVTHAWMDDAFDTQRRRGVDTLLRTSVTI